MMETKQKERVRSKSNQGFTLIEAIAVLIILGILGVVIASRVSSTSTYSVKSQAEVLKSHIRYAQTMAMSTGIIWGINIPDSKQYFLFRGTVATPVILPGADSNPVVLEANGPSLSTGTVRFDGKGSPVVGYTPSFTVTMGGETETINITQNTGFIP
jgi:prepilin-type N-terminal cleavage/methylation domain-containing protein